MILLSNSNANPSSLTIPLRSSITSIVCASASGAGRMTTRDCAMGVFLRSFIWTTRHPS